MTVGKSFLVTHLAESSTSTVAPYGWSQVAGSVTTYEMIPRSAFRKTEREWIIEIVSITSLVEIDEIGIIMQ